MPLARWLSIILCSLVLPAPTLPTSFVAWSQLRPYLLLMLPCPCSDSTYFFCSLVPATTLLTAYAALYLLRPYLLLMQLGPSSSDSTDLTNPSLPNRPSRHDLPANHNPLSTQPGPSSSDSSSETQANRIDQSDMTFPRTTSHPARSLVLPAPTLLTNRIDPTT